MAVPNIHHGPDVEEESNAFFPFSKGGALAIILILVVILGPVLHSELANKALNGRYSECDVTSKSKDRYIFHCSEPEMFQGAVDAFLAKNSEHQILGIVAKKR